jgi:hypothetical protein
MEDEDLDDLLEEYLSGRLALNPDLEDVEFVWVRDNPNYGTLHIQAHEVEEHEVEEVIQEVPPEVETKKHPTDDRRTYFWGATRQGRWLFVACEDWTEGNTRFLKPITAFEPEQGESYWRQQ